MIFDLLIRLNTRVVVMDVSIVAQTIDYMYKIDKVVVLDSYIFTLSFNFRFRDSRGVNCY